MNSGLRCASRGSAAAGPFSSSGPDGGHAPRPPIAHGQLEERERETSSVAGGRPGRRPGVVPDGVREFGSGHPKRPRPEPPVPPADRPRETQRAATGRSGRPDHLRRRRRARACSIRCTPPTVRRSGWPGRSTRAWSASSRAPPTSSPRWPSRGSSPPDGLTWTFKLPDGREVPRRHPGRCRGRLLQPRPDVHPDRRRRHPGRSTGRTTWAGSRTRWTTPARRCRASTSPARPTATNGRRQADHAYTSKFPAILGLPSFSIQSPTALKQYDANNVVAEGDSFVYPAYATEHPTGTGPFKFQAYDKANNTVTLVRNDDYWGEKAKSQDADLQDHPGRDRPQAGAAGRHHRRLRPAEPGRLGRA